MVYCRGARLAGVHFFTALASMQLTSEQQALLLDLARGAIRCALSPHPVPHLPEDPQLHQPAGCFVSLHELRTHRLRGCVGRLDAKGPLAQTVAVMAQAVLEDPRFLMDPVMLGDLPMLDLELSILSPLTPAQSPLDFNPSEHGIYLTYADRSGCFLPQVARDTGWGREQLLDRLCTEKMGLPSIAWPHPPAKLHRFTPLLV